MNFGEITDAAIAQVLSLSRSNQIIDANRTFVKAMINKGYHIIERRALWKFSEGEGDITAVANTRNCADLPSDFGIPLAVWSDRLKCEITYHDERQKFFQLDATGLVQYYGIWDDEFRWYPLPTQAEDFVLRYYAKWADLSADEDEPVIPATWHDLLIDHASGWLAMRLPPTGDRFLPGSRAEPFLASFEARLEEMANSDLVLKSWDAVPNYGYEDNVLGLGEW